MFFSPQLRFQQKSDMHLELIADEIKRQAPSVSIAPFDKRGKETYWGGGVVTSFRVSTEVSEDPFLYVGVDEAVLVPGEADEKTFGQSLQAISRCVTFQRPDAGLAVGLFVGYLGLGAFMLNYLSDQYRYENIVGYVAVLMVVLVISLIAMAWRAYRNPEQGRSSLVMVLLFPSLLLLSPMSLLNIPVLKFLLRTQGYRISQGL